MADMTKNIQTGEIDIDRFFNVNPYAAQNPYQMDMTNLYRPGAGFNMYVYGSQDWCVCACVCLNMRADNEDC